MIPPEATAWLEQVKQELAPLPEGRRVEVVEDLCQHILDGLDRGLSAGETLARLGTPEQIATSTLPSTLPRAAPTDGPRPYLNPRRVAQVVALVLAVTASLALVFLPVGIEVTETATSGVAGTTEVESVSLLTEDGWIALVPLSIPVLLAALPLVSGRRCPRWLAIVQAALLGAFLVVSLLSVGIFYAPAFLAALTGVFLRGGSPAAKA